MSELTERTRDAYVAGWALSGGPMTDRVKAGLTAALALAADDPDRPDLLEATLHIGKLEGTWAQVFADREDIHTEYGPKITAAYRALTKATLDIRGAVRAFRAQIHGKDKAAIRSMANAAALRLVHAAANASRPEYRATQKLLGDAITAAENAGRSAGHLLAGMGEADDPDPRSHPDHQQLTAAALALLIRGSTTDVARRLAKLAAQDDLSDDEWDAELEGITSGDGERSSSLLGDLTIGRGFLAGMLGAFASLGLRQVNWLTAGDTHVCPTCDEYENNNPYTLLTVPSVSHPSCRCVIAPA